ncbi:MAG: glycosyltransferase [Emcibacteraceae bacterium]|nr:glycosyltransferase [Emcibacteraceae bacterium]
MQILHICGNAIASRVHEEIIDRLDIHNSTSSTVVVPVKYSQREKAKHLFNWRDDIILIVYPDYLRYFPILKIFFNYIILLLKLRKCEAKFDIIVGHSIWTDGALCCLYALHHTGKFFLFMRNTDYNTFFKIPHVSIIMHFIIRRSSVVITPSKVYYNKLISKVSQSSKKKIRYIPNGIDDFWFENQFMDEGSERVDFIFVGKNDNNKNILNVLSSIGPILEAKKIRHLHIVGIELAEFVNKHPDVKIFDGVIFHGKITDKHFLKSLYRCSKALVVPSFVETFGLVYIEALTQRCGVVCSVGQGISEDPIPAQYMYLVNPHSTDSIARGVRHFDKQRIVAGDITFLESYQWSTVIGKMSHNLFTEHAGEF